MRQTKLSEEEVADIVAELISTGRTPSAAAVREVLKARKSPGEVGSPNTIQRMLGKLRQARPHPVDPAGPSQTLPKHLLLAIEQHAENCTRLAKEEADARIRMLETELAELAEVGEALERRIEEASEQLTLRTSERDAAIGQRDDRVSEVDRLRSCLQREQEVSGTARLELAKAEVLAASAQERVQQSRQQAESALSELAEVKLSCIAERELRLAAERRADVAEARGALLEAGKAIAEDSLAGARTRIRVLEDAEKIAAAQGVVVEELRAQLDVMRRLLHDRKQPAPVPLKAGQP